MKMKHDNKKIVLPCKWCAKADAECLLYISSLYYKYSSNVSNTSDINSNLYLFYFDYVFLSSNFFSCPYRITITYPHTS